MGGDIDVIKHVASDTQGDPTFPASTSDTEIGRYKILLTSATRRRDGMP